ncbi:MAG: O-antigen ligase family protein [Candidatus Hydrogenedentota bacterium]
MTDASPSSNDRPSLYVLFLYGLFLIVLLATPLTVSGWVDDMADKWFLIRTAGPLLLVLLLFYLSGKEIRRAPLPLLPVLVIALTVTQALSLTDTTNIGISMTVITRQLGLLAFFFLARYFSSNASLRSGILYTFVILGTATSVYGIAQHFGYDFIDWQKFSEVPTRRGTSFMGHATFAGSVLIIIMPLTVVTFLSVRARVPRILCAVAFLLLFYHLSFTGARVATLALFLAAGVGLLIAFFARRKLRDTDDDIAPGSNNEYDVVLKLKKEHLNLVAIAFFVVGIVFVGRAWQEKGSDVFGLKEGGMAQRIFAWETANRMFVAHPVNGVGVGNYEIASPPYWNRIEAIRYSRYLRALYQPHNEYIETAAETGFIGVACLIGILVVALTQCVSAIPRSPILYSGLLVALIATALDACFIFPWQVPESALLFWILLGIIDGAQPQQESASV